MNEIRYGFLFDLDGVLIDSEREYSRIWASVNAEFNTGIENLEVKIKGCTLDKILSDYFPDPELQKKVVEKLYELEGRMHYEYLPGAQALLYEINSSGYPLALVTSSNNDKMKHLKEEIPELLNYFNAVVTADMISCSKPDPESYLKGAELLEVEIKNCAVFEDSLQGVKAGKSAGAFVIGVAGTMSREVLAPYSDIVIDSLEDIVLEDIIRKIDVEK